MSVNYSLQLDHTATEEILNNSSNHADKLHKQGLVYLQQSEFAQAIKIYYQAIKINPNSAEFYKNLGNAFLLQNKDQAALKCYLKAIEINPNFAEIYAN